MKVSTYWSLLLTIALTMVGMTFGIIPSVFLAVFIAVITAIVRSRRRQERIKCRQLYPKDYAYYLYFELASKPATERVELFLNEFPKMNEVEIKAWLTEFEEVNSYTERIAAAGSLWVLSKEKIQELFLAKFPFLAMLGLHYAVGRSAAYARYKGYDKHPMLKPDEI